MPSIPAIIIAEKAMYGLAKASPERNLSLFAYGLGPVRGILTAADLLPWE